MKKLNSQGFSLVEIVNSMMLFGLMAASAGAFRMVMARTTSALEDKSFAAEKALQMFNEIDSVAENPRFGTLGLDAFNDGPTFDLILTTDKNVDKSGGDPADPLSGNRLSNGHWRFLRQVEVNPFKADPYARQVVVRIWRTASDAPPIPGDLLATMAGIVGP